MGTKDDEYDMAVWCFGQDTWNGFLFNEKDSIDLLQAWNKRHGDLLLLHEYDAVSNSMARMKEFWRQYKDGKDMEKKKITTETPDLVKKMFGDAAKKQTQTKPQIKVKLPKGFGEVK